MKFDPFSDSFAKNPYAAYKELRLRDKPFYFAEQDIWLLSRYEDVSEIALNPQAVRSLAGYLSPRELAARQRKANWHDMPYHERFVQFSLLDSDGEIHHRLRSQVFKSFTSRSIADLEPLIQGFVDRLMTKLEVQDQIDFVNDFAVHIPGFVIGKLLGVAAEDCQQLRIWSENVVRFFDVDRSDKLKEIAETSTREFYEYLVELKRQRTRQPQDDLISSMIANQAKGSYSEGEFISTCMLILMAGQGSTTDVLSSGMHVLLRYPDALKKLRDDRSLLPAAIQEMFRFESPLPFFHRHMTEDITIRGHSFPAGTTFGLLYGSANRDASQFEDPDTFNIQRQPNRHLAFGKGIHLCLGNHLARLNMKIIFATLLRRFSSFKLVDKNVVYKPGLSVRGPVSMSILWAPTINQTRASVLSD